MKGHLGLGLISWSVGVVQSLRRWEASGQVGMSRSAVPVTTHTLRQTTCPPIHTHLGTDGCLPAHTCAHIPMHTCSLPCSMPHSHTDLSVGLCPYSKEHTCRACVQPRSWPSSQKPGRLRCTAHRHTRLSSYVSSCAPPSPITLTSSPAFLTSANVNVHPRVIGLGFSSRGKKSYLPKSFESVAA